MNRKRIWVALGACALLLGAVSPHFAEKVEAKVSLAPATIPHDCSADATAALNSWIASAPDYSTLIFTPGGCYRVDGQLTVADRHGLVLRGNGATLRQMKPVDLTAPVNGNDAIIQIERGTDHQVLDLNLVGPHPDYDDYNPYVEHLPGIRVRGTDGLLLDGVGISFVWGDFVELKPNVSVEPKDTPTRNVVIRSSTFNRSGRQGIYMTAAEDVLIERNTITNAHFSAIDNEGAAGTDFAHDITIRDNTVVGPDTFHFVTATHGRPSRRDWRIVDNRLQGLDLSIILYSLADNPIRNVVVAGNTSDTPGGMAIRLYAVHGGEVRDNVAVMRRDKIGMEIQSVDGVVIRDNIFKGASSFMAVDRGVWKNGPYIGPPSVNYTTCNNIITASGQPPAVDGTC